MTIYGINAINPPSWIFANFAMYFNLLLLLIQPSNHDENLYSGRSKGAKSEHNNKITIHTS